MLDLTGYYLTQVQTQDVLVTRNGKIVARISNPTLNKTEILDSLVGIAADIQLALKLGFADFEDAIVAATAKRERADYIITRNVRDYTTSPVPALTPTEFLADLGQD